jgi:hypothetical protein
MSKRSTLHLKPKPAPSEAAGLQKLTSIIDQMGQHAPSPKSGTIDALKMDQNRGKILYAALADRPELLAKVAAMLQGDGLNISTSVASYAITMTLRSITQSADCPPCSKCEGPNDRLPQRYCSSCHREYEGERSARERQELKRLRQRQRGLARF